MHTPDTASTDHHTLNSEPQDSRDKVLISVCVSCACGTGSCCWQHILWVLSVSMDLTLDAVLSEYLLSMDPWNMHDWI
jgi:hypothetical protein